MAAPLGQGAATLGSLGELVHGPPHVGLHGRPELGVGRQRGIDGPEPRQDAPQQHRDAGPRLRAPELQGERRLHRAAALVPQHHEERRLQVRAGVLEAPQDLGGHDVARDAHDEEIPEPLVEQELRRNPGVAAPEDRGKRPLALRPAAPATRGPDRPGAARSSTNRPLPVIRRRSAAAPAGSGRRAPGGRPLPRSGHALLYRQSQAAPPRPLGSPSHASARLDLAW